MCLKIIEISLGFIDTELDHVLKLIGNIIQINPNDEKNYKLLNKSFITKIIDNIKVNINQIHF